MTFVFLQRMSLDEIFKESKYESQRGYLKHSDQVWFKTNVIKIRGDTNSSSLNLVRLDYPCNIKNCLPPLIFDYKVLVSNVNGRQEC